MAFLAGVLALMSRNLQTMTWLPSPLNQRSCIITRLCCTVDPIVAAHRNPGYMLANKTWGGWVISGVEMARVVRRNDYQLGCHYLTARRSGLNFGSFRGAPCSCMRSPELASIMVISQDKRGWQYVRGKPGGQDSYAHVSHMFQVYHLVRSFGHLNMGNLSS